VCAAATALLSDGEQLDIDKLEREKVVKKQRRDEEEYQGLERAVLAELGLDPDKYVVVEDRDEGRRHSNINVDSVRLELAASGTV
jgi:hypothetical protein